MRPVYPAATRRNDRLSADPARFRATRVELGDTLLESSDIVRRKNSRLDQFASLGLGPGYMPYAFPAWFRSNSGAPACTDWPERRTPAPKVRVPSLHLHTSR